MREEKPAVGVDWVALVGGWDQVYSKEWHGVGCGAIEARVVGSVCFLFVGIHWMERMNEIKVGLDETS